MGWFNRLRIAHLQFTGGLIEKRIRLAEKTAVGGLPHYDQHAEKLRQRLARIRAGIARRKAVEQVGTRHQT